MFMLENDNLRVIELIIPGKPYTYRTPRIFQRNGNQVRYDELAQEKKDVRVQILEQYEGPIIEGPVEVQFFFEMPIPDSYSKKRKENLLWTPHYKKPDCTNMMKFYEDCLKGTVIKDDALVIRGMFEKIYSDTPLVAMNVRAVGE